MANKNEEKQKNVVIPNILTFCKANRNCCMDNSSCSGTYTQSPTGSTAFYKCGCM
ncbi:hypothetical protein P4679_30850 [Priestia megaterium]|uniref:hypothetical protein n=1 Tax=Priestia megaterium TaxID=1404 RepID=UPI002E1D969A|nr:hypothetical protein [Priestia megaterium]